MLKVAVVLVDRANYGRLKPVMELLREASEINLQVVCAGTMMLDRFGLASGIVESDGFVVDEKIFMEVEGSVPSSMAKSIGLGIIEFANAFQRLRPDFVLVIGDRYEALSASIACVYQNLCLIHLQGGEVSGSIDESTRHAVTKLAHYHFPATKRAAEIIIRMGEDPKTVFALGCPSADVVSRARKELPLETLQRLGVGRPLEFSRRYIVVVYHPVTTEYESAESQMNELLEAVHEAKEQFMILWPNIDAGSNEVSQAIRRYREYHPDAPMHAYKNFEPEDFIPILANAVCAVGNSSSFIRDASFLGTPIVLVGSRQDGREWSEAVIRVNPTKAEILSGIRKSMARGPSKPSTIYGTPGVSKAIVDTLITLRPYLQKRLLREGEVARG